MAIEAPALGPLLGNTVNTVITPFYTLFSTNATYCFTAHTNVRNHRTETETLKCNLLRVKQRIVDSEMNGLIPTDEAEEWVRRAEQAISEEAANRESFVQRCRIFGCSLNCWGNYKTSKKAAEKVDAVRKYISSTPLPENVTRTPPPPRVVDLSTHPAQLLPSRERTLQHALGCIKEEDAVRVIGIWGPRGVGKTHLLTKINNSFLEHCPFDIVILIKATSECTVQKVQAQIIKRFGITQNVNVTAQIYEVLKKRSFLVLVDDLREKIDLSAAGIPHPLGVVDQKKRKVLIISPSQSICDLMGVDKYIQVLGLEEEEAHQLFEQSFGEENLYTDPHVGVLAKDLVRELIGRPSELIHFGKMMRRSRNARQWEDVIDALKTSNLRKDNPLCMAERIVGSLEDSTKDLIARKNDVCQKIKNAEREGKKSTNEVDRWLEKVAEIIDSVHVISVDSKLKKDVTMEGSEKLREVQECLSSCPGSVAIESMPPPVQEMPGPSMSAENRNLQDALHFIKDDPKVGMIGIWGPGGVGKSHLLNNINNSFADGMTFDFVVFVTASKGCSVEKVQSQIIERLRLQSSTGSKCLTIYEYMKTKSFLVLLDDLWDGIDLQDVGIPYPLGNVNKLNRKVVLTTRLSKVCGQMKVKKELKVAYLQEHEAWHLFEENIGAETLSSPHIEALARELMKELKGLPLALITIGKAMYQKNVYQWETAIQYMKQSCCVDDKDPIELGMETNVFKKLKFSYDNLRDNTLRACFLTCVLWPEDAQISIVDLAECWMGLGLVNGPDIESSFRRSYSLIADLTAACLLDGCEYDAVQLLLERSDGCVKVHDVIRDMALWISCDCGEKNDKWIVAAPGGRDQKVIILSNEAECISLTSNRIPIRFDLHPINLRILCLRNNELDESIIVEAIKNCISLTYLDLTGNGFKRIPEELCSLVNLEYLDLSENQFGETQEVPYSFGKLINLKFLYLRYSRYVRIPAGVIGRLKELKVIDLRSWIVPVAEWTIRELGTLPQLKAVGITIRARGLDELESLLGEGVRYSVEQIDADLTATLSTGFAQRTLYQLDMYGCYSEHEEITVRHLGNSHFGALNNLRLSEMASLREIKWMGATPAFIFPRLTLLELFGCTSLSHLSWVMHLPRLEELRIGGCHGMVQAFMRCHGDKLCNGSAEDKTKTFPCLKILVLREIESLETIGDDGMEFPSLERLVLFATPKLKRLPFQQMDSLPLKLKELRFQHAQFWDRLECQQGVKTLLQPLVKFGW